MAPDLAAALAASLLAILALASGATLRALLAPKSWYLGIALVLALLTFALVWLLTPLRP
jgi:hypothetical protein